MHPVFVPTALPSAPSFALLPRRCARLPSAVHLRKRFPRAAAVGAGAGANPPSEPRRPGDSRFSSNSSNRQGDPLSEASQASEDVANDSSHGDDTDSSTASRSGPDVSSFARLSQPAISIDPVKNVPTSLIDASGALQIDDGSLEAVTVLPRRLVRRRKRTVDIEFLKRQLRAGFDSGVGATIVLMLMFASWYWANTAFNVYNKQVLKVFPYPLTCTVVQFAVAALVMAMTWITRMKKPPKLNSFLLKAALPLACLHAAGFLLTNMSLGKVSVAFTHTVKSTEPFFSVALTPSILGDVPTWGILVSLFPIVAGVGLASAADVSFNWIGFLSAVGSNLALQSRNVLSKRLMDVNDGNGNGRLKPKKPMTREEEDTLMSLDNINLFSTMSILAFFVLIPICLLWEGLPLLGAASFQAAGVSTGRLYVMLIMGGICRCLDVLISYVILKRVSAVTHSVGNCVKRAVVIVASVFVFKTKMTMLSIIGTTMALTGVLIYSLIVSACKQNSFGPDSPFCKPIYEIDELELTEGGGI
ncbi:Phosphoenolpyruvate/phosphate translocator 2, chloroplastic [Gracilariopsis chorda]|uniref:Phosphoenolpyruvate/phosphate translocator 2, chloroplastic n=1 Tax=Gracilariopsis chorda TaxID=448386 RepID=A0A2V3IYV2_9FLOR|nr:Phosphoenolpyruvate/phosphate translocator 2, chloroplastic [Gracilariopsis chorda]|eukprot:PXF47301.1 Phosphoenolpyruvate/phosphate translocator 2, chloroplastic [Gracilariopsis chorda]